MKKDMLIILLSALLIAGFIYHRRQMTKMWDIVEWNQNEAEAMWHNFTDCANNQEPK